jgi:hypothetical protein
MIIRAFVRYVEEGGNVRNQSVYLLKAIGDQIMYNMDKLRMRRANG